MTVRAAPNVIRRRTGAVVPAEGGMTGHDQSWDLADAAAVTAAADTEPGAPRSSAASRRPLAPGIRVGRYRIIGMLGCGAMGTVYRAWDSRLGRCVALKLRSADHGRTGVDCSRDGRAERARFMQEARGMARLAHPNVVEVFAVERLEGVAGLAPGACGIAMEMVEGITLDRWITRRRPWREVLAVFEQAGRGLAAAHAAGLVHRDFKPANVILGQDGRARVMDFGLVAALDDVLRTEPSMDIVEDVATTLTRTGTTVGTPAYMSPEQHLGYRAGPRSDQFAFCVALFEALFGHRPFMGDTCRVLSVDKQLGRWKSPAVGHAVPPAILAALERGMSPEECDRFASMQELLAALRPRPRRLRRLARTAFATMTVVALGTAAGFAVPATAHAVSSALTPAPPG